MGTVIVVMAIAFTITVLQMKGLLKIEEVRCCACCRRKKKMGEIEIDLTEFNEVVEILENGKVKYKEQEKEVQKI